VSDALNPQASIAAVKQECAFRAEGLPRNLQFCNEACDQWPGSIAFDVERVVKGVAGINGGVLRLPEVCHKRSSHSGPDPAASVFPSGENATDHAIPPPGRNVSTWSPVAKFHSFTVPSQLAVARARSSGEMQI